MALSGSFDFTLTRDQLIKRSLDLIGVYDVTDTANADDITAAALHLNLIVKEMVAEGIDLPMRKLFTLFLQKDQQSYNLGTGSTDHYTESYVQTETTADAVDTDLTLVVTSTTGMTAGNYLGIVLDSGTIQWTTIDAVDSATGLTLDDALTGDVASGAMLVVYTTKTQRPQRIINAYTRSNDDTSDVPVEIVGYLDYSFLTPKSATGRVNQIHYNPSLTAGILYAWPVYDTNYRKLVMLMEGPMGDFDASTDNPYFPVEWFNILVWRLASELAFVYDIPREKRESIYQKALEKTAKLLMYDTEDGTLRLSVDTQGR